MGKKMKLPFLFKNTSSTSSSSWPWPSCNQPRTLSFRSPGCGDIFKTINSAYLDADAPESSFFTTSSESASFSTASTEDCAAAAGGADLTEMVIRGLRSSERLFFEPGETNSILEEAKSCGGGGGETAAFKESLVMSLESRDPYVDFRQSMEEMVEAHGIQEWDNLEELLCWYLRVNVKQNHEYIVGAFVDLLVTLAIKAPNSTDCASSSPSSSTSRTSHHHHQQNQDSPSSPLSFYTSSSSSSSSSTTTPCVSSSLELVDDEKEIQEIEEDGDVSCIPVA